MELDQHSKLLRIFIGELDKLNGAPLYEAIVLAAKKEGMHGATVLRGILSYGASSHIHSAKLVEMSYDLPVIVEIVDTEGNIEKILKTVNRMIEESGCGALVTVEKAEVIYYKPKSK